jgi:energy-converting hydrogenase Eha subunit F
MKSRRRIHRRRAVVAVLAALAVPVVAVPSALAVPADQSYPRPVPQKIEKIGDTPSDFAQPTTSAAVIGDTKFDSPGATRAPQYDPNHTIQVVRPERTVVREVDAFLPIALSAAALLVALALAGTALIRVRSLRLG